MDFVSLKIITLLILALGMVRGFYRGFSKTLLSMISLIVVLACSMILTPAVSRYLSESKAVKEFYVEKTGAVVDSYMNAAETGALAEEPSSGGNPANAQQVLVALIASALATGEMRDVITSKIVSFAITLTAALVTFIASSLIFSFLSMVISGIFSGRTMRSIDRFMGLLLGGLWAFGIIWIGYGLISLFSNTPEGSALLAHIKVSPFLLMIYEMNPLAKILPLLLGTVAGRL